MLDEKIKAYLNNFFWLFLTFLLAPYFYLLIFLTHCFHTGKRRKEKKLKILVNQTAKIGDLVCTTSVFREIRKKFPSCYLAALIISKTKGVLKNNPRLNETIILGDFEGIVGKIRLIKKLRKEKYDWLFNVLPDSFDNIIGLWSLIPNRVITTYKYSGEITKLLSIFNNYRLEYKRHTSAPEHYLNLLKFVGIKECSQAREVFIQPIEEEKASNFLREHNLKKEDLLIGISATAGIKLIEWLPDRFAKVADRLIEELQAKIIFISSADERLQVAKVQQMMRNNSVNSCGCFELHELAALMKKLKLFISVDTGTLFIADAMAVSTVVVVGPSDIDMKEQPPLSKRCKMIQKNVYCRPCSFIAAAPRVCREGHRRCLTDITAEEVFQAVHSLLKN